MLERIRGRVERVLEHSVDVRVAGLTLRLLVPAFLSGRLRQGEETELWTYFVLQQEGNRLVPVLVGFPAEEDRDFFLRFISVSGVGTRAAVRALTRPSGEVGAAIACGDDGLLTTLPGIGKARARKIIASLQDELRELYPFAGVGGEEAGSGYDEAVAVLIQLGVSRTEACSLVSSAVEELGDETESSELVRSAMRNRKTR